MQASSLRSEDGFSLIELLVVVALIGILASVAIGVTPGVIRSAEAEGAAVQVTSFLERARETSISRRRNIEIRFIGTNQLQSVELPVPDPDAAEPPAERILETITFEGGLEYDSVSGQPDTPDLFGRSGDNPINLNGAARVMFTTEGSFTDGNGDPVNATIFLSKDEQPLTANAVTLIGVTAAIRSWRWDGRSWVQ